MINEFRDEFSFIDYQQWTPEVKQWGVCKVGGGEPPKYLKPDDCICVFLNFKKLGEFKDKASANVLIRKLLDNAPVSLKEFEGILLL